MEPNLEIRPHRKSGLWGIYETGSDADDPLVMFANQKNAELVMSEMLVQPSVLLYAKLLNRLSNAIYDTKEVQS